MIREDALLDAIAECHGQKNPNANTCVKLAAYYTILNNLREKPEPVRQTPDQTGYSYDPPVYSSDTEFGQILGEKSEYKVFEIIDELMETLRLMNRPLYNAVMRKLAALD